MKKIILLCLLSFIAFSSQAQIIPQKTIRTQEALNAYKLATVPGYKVVLNENYAHYVSKTGPEHFVIRRAEYERRLAYEREMKKLEREREQIQKSIRKISQQTKRF